MRRRLLTIPEDRSTDMCPICKTDKYLSPNMKFLINPECYHRMCESCVDRIFSFGPAPCPYSGCSKILRKNKFKRQVFDDLAIEKEIDVRKRVSAIYNKTEEDFKSLDEYNRYLEEVENIIFKLSNGIDVEETRAALSRYENEHKIEALEKNMRENRKTSDLQKYQESAARLKQEKLRIEKQMELEDAAYQKQQKQELLNKLSNSVRSSSDEIVTQVNENLRKRSLSRKKQLQQITNQLEQDFQSSNPLAKGAEQNIPENASPFTPFAGDRDLHKRYRVMDSDVSENLKDIAGNHSYYDPYADRLSRNKQFLGSGWRVNSFFERALEEAFRGLGCFIEKEKN